MNFTDYLTTLLGKRSIVILGFGREGRSTYQLLRKLFPGRLIAIADSSADSVSLKEAGARDPDLKIIAGDQYLEYAFTCDVIFKSPGVPLTAEKVKAYNGILTSQSDIFLRYYAGHTIGITGTKGKSTTTSLIYNILLKAGKKVFLAGNIGIPVFDVVEEAGDDGMVVFELSSHQLEYIERSPHTAVLLNIYEDHLDHFITHQNYTRAKENIILHQLDGDVVIINRDQDKLPAIIGSRGLKRSIWQISLYPHNETGAWAEGEQIFCRDRGGKITTFNFSGRNSLLGRHNLYNIMAAACTALSFDVDPLVIEACILGFRGLPHRMEFVGTYHGILFYNDAIATIPEATISAVEALKNVDTLIVGGKDRGIDYSVLIRYLDHAALSNLILTGESGRRIYGMLHSRWKTEKRCFLLDRFADFLEPALKYTAKGMICLLSPASASYDEFRNFEDKGAYYKKIVSTI